MILTVIVIIIKTTICSFVAHLWFTTLYVIIVVHITGMCNSRMFEDRDVTFTMGCGSEADIVPGVEMALKKFRCGEKSRLKIGASYSYGSEGCPAYDIAPGAELTYDVEMRHFVRVILSSLTVFKHNYHPHN